MWSVRGVGPVTLREVRMRLGPLEALFEQPVERWAPLVPWRADAAEHIAGIGTLAQRAEQLEHTCARSEMELIFRGDPAWPSRLDSLRDAPPLLFVRGPGARAPVRRRLAIVGTRSVDLTSANRLCDIACEAAMAGLGIVSGAASGVDQAAHRGALAAEGETWAFMGSGLDEIDAPQQTISAQILAAGGTLFSQFPPGFRSNRSSFTLRNRLISGASDAVLVFRSKLKSGAHYTAQAALDQGRALLATPGEPWNIYAQGPNELIRSGRALPHLDLNDLLKAVGLTGTISPQAPVEFDRTSLSPGAAAVLDVLETGSSDFEALMVTLSAMSSGQLAAALVELEVLGAVLHKGGKRYEKR